MTEWQVFGVITALAAFVVSVVTPLIKLNTVITKLTGLVDSIAKDLADLTNRNAASHDRIFSRIEAADARIQDHETRITVIEKGEHR